MNIASEAADCAICAGNLNDMTMIGRKLFELDFIIGTAPSYLAKYGEPKIPAELKNHHSVVSYFLLQLVNRNPYFLPKSVRLKQFTQVNFLQMKAKD